MKLAFSALTALGLSASPILASTVVNFDFRGDGGNLGTTSQVFDGDVAGFSVTAFGINIDETNDPDAPELFQTSGGLGVDTDPGDSDSSEIDDIGTNEAIVLDFGEAVTFGTVRISSVGSNDDARFFATNDSSVTTFGQSTSALFEALAGSDLIDTDNNSADLSSFAPFRYLVATTTASTNSDNNDYKLKSVDVTYHVAPIPLPAAGWLLLAGVGGIAAVSRRRTKSAP